MEFEANFEEGPFTKVCLGLQNVSFYHFLWIRKLGSSVFKAEGELFYGLESPTTEIFSLLFYKLLVIITYFYNCFICYMSNISKEILNHCFEDMEKFMTRLQQTAEAQSVLNQRTKKNGKKNSKNAKQGGKQELLTLLAAKQEKLN